MKDRRVVPPHGMHDPKELCAVLDLTGSASALESMVSGAAIDLHQIKPTKDFIGRAARAQPTQSSADIPYVLNHVLPGASVFVVRKASRCKLMHCGSQTSPRACRARSGELLRAPSASQTPNPATKHAPQVVVRHDLARCEIVALSWKAATGKHVAHIVQASGCFGPTHSAYVSVCRCVCVLMLLLFTCACNAELVIHHLQIALEDEDAFHYSNGVLLS